jgi:hypothetical protein
MDDLTKLAKENEQLKEELKRLYGLDRPFICGNSGNIDPEDKMPTHVLVCPAYGADGFALYKKVKPYTAPGY